MASISTLVDRVKIVVLSSGTGAFQLGNAVPAYRGIEALIDGLTYSYAIESGSNYEAGTGLYDAGSNILIRSPVISSNGGATISFPANIELIFTALAQDILPPGSLPITQEEGEATDLAVSQKLFTDTVTALTETINSIATGAFAFVDLPDTANGDTPPPDGSNLMYVDATFVKIAS